MEERGSSIALAENNAATTLTTVEVKAIIKQEVGELVTWVWSGQSLTFFAFEAQLVPRVLALGCLFVQLFLCMRHEEFQAAHTDPEPGYKSLGPYSCLLGTFFGKVRYWRMYFYSKGYYPLDVELGLSSDGFSMVLRSYAARVATKVSCAQAALLLTTFLRWSPVQESIEGMVLGLGRHTGAWFESAPAPEGDGEVLIIQIDSKATPTATEAELKKRHPGDRSRPRSVPARSCEPQLLSGARL